MAARVLGWDVIGSEEPRRVRKFEPARGRSIRMASDSNDCERKLVLRLLDDYHRGLGGLEARGCDSSTI